MSFFKEILKIENDGILNINEAIAVAIICVALFMVIYMLKRPISNLLNRILPGRKKTIFSHRKNQYKNRIGKKSKASKKKTK